MPTATAITAYFQDEVIKPMALEWNILAFHCSLPLACAGGDLTMVVLASHSSPTETELRVLATKPRRSKKPRAESLAATEISLVPRAAASVSSASHSMAPAPCPAAAGCT